MAIIDVLPGISIAVKVSGTPLEEHLDHDENDGDAGGGIGGKDTNTRYIEAITGQIIEIAISAEAGTTCPGDSIMFDICVDGLWVGDPIIDKLSCLYGHTIVSEGRVLSDGVRVNKYRFAALGIADTRSSKEEIQRLEDLGTIHIKASYVKHLGRLDQIRSGEVEINALAEVSEKALKGQTVSHGVAYV